MPGEAIPTTHSNTPAAASEGKRAESGGKQSPIENSETAALAGTMSHLGFWQHPVVQNVLPLITSLVFHLTLLIIGVLVYATTQIITRSVLREQIIVPEASMVAGAAVGGLPNPGLGNDPNLSAGQVTDSTIAPADGWASRPSESLTATLMGGGQNSSADSVIGIGPKSGLVGAGQGTGGTQGGGPLAPYGPGGGMGLAPKSPFMGISGNAKKVVYICDASGSMMSVKDRVQAELSKAVSVLSPIQAFNVIFSLNEDVTPLSRDTLVMATPDNKRKAIEMAAGISYAGPTGPLPAIRLAFAQKPELIYVLTDGFEAVASYDEVIREFDRLNQDRKIKVNTIMIRGSVEPELERVLQTIASKNGGVCKIVDRAAW